MVKSMVHVATCDDGDAVLNGVYSITPSIDPVNSSINVLFEGAASASSSDFADVYVVFVSYSNARGTGAFLAVAAQCFDNPPAHIP